MRPEDRTQLSTLCTQSGALLALLPFCETFDVQRLIAFATRCSKAELMPGYAISGWVTTPCSDTNILIFRLISVHVGMYASILGTRSGLIRIAHHPPVFP